MSRSARSTSRQPDACGALGCRETQDLREVTSGGVTRTLCEDCAQQFKRR